MDREYDVLQLQLYVLDQIKPSGSGSWNKRPSCWCMV